MKTLKRTKQKSIYVLTAYCIREDADSKPKLAQDKTSVMLRDNGQAVFTSVKAAEKAITKLVAGREHDIEKGWEDYKYFGFALVEHYLDDPFYGDGYVCSFRSYRTYLPDGKLNYFSDTDEACCKKFRGTSCPSRFKSGDFAWILRSGHAVPTLVEAEPLTKEEWKKHFKTRAAGDFTDDSGIDFPFGCKGHDHTFAPLVFPERSDLEIPDEAKSAMRAARRNYLNYGA